MLAAASADEAARTLRSGGNVILDLREQRNAPEKAKPTATVRARKRARKDDVIFFCNQLAVMVDTGVPLPEALDSIAAGTHSLAFKAILDDVSEQVKAGVEFSTALDSYGRVFNKLFVSLVRASEATGTLGLMLQRVAGYLMAQRQLYRRVKGAMAYPIAMLCFCILVVTGMLMFILPRFEKIYMGKMAALPAPTKILLGLSRFLTGHWLALLMALAALGIGVYLLVRTPRGSLLIGRLRLHLPLLGALTRKASLARSLRTLATMISSGVGMLDALAITADVAGNALFGDTWRGLIARLKEGASLSEEMKKSSWFPRSVTQMVAAGEKTGKLGLVLDRISTFCEDDLDITIKTLTSFIEPAMIVVMGTVVGGIAMALLLPVFSLSKVVAH